MKYPHQMSPYLIEVSVPRPSKGPRPAGPSPITALSWGGGGGGVTATHLSR